MIIKHLYYIDSNFRTYDKVSKLNPKYITDVIFQEKYNIDRNSTEILQDDISSYTPNVTGFYYIKYPTGVRKVYALKCNECSKNSVLHGEGIYLVHLSHIKNGIISCGCAKRTNWTPYQYYIKMISECKNRNCIFLGYDKKHLRLYCLEHGYWNTTSKAHFFNGKGCSKCGDTNSRVLRTKDSYFHISKFKNTNAYNYRRSDKIDSSGRLRYWEYMCEKCSHDEYVRLGLCNGIFTSFNSDLVKGKKSCRCSSNYRWTEKQREYQITKLLKSNFPHISFKGWVNSYKNIHSKAILNCNIHNNYTQKVNYILNNNCGCPQCAGMTQTECYINVIYDVFPIAIKYGISTHTKNRVCSQNNKSPFDVINHGIWDFENPYLCKMAENECKRTVSRVLSERELPDGFTETAEVKYIDDIIKIYESWGGIKRK